MKFHVWNSCVEKLTQEVVQAIPSNITTLNLISQKLTQEVVQAIPSNITTLVFAKIVFAIVYFDQ